MLLEDSILLLTGGGFNAEGAPLEPALRRRYRMGIQTGGVMTDNKYFLNGVLIIAFLFVVSYFLVGWTGRYQLGQANDDYATWKIDTVTGQVWVCRNIRSGCASFNPDQDQPTTD
jgi:hypothetical protein